VRYSINLVRVVAFSLTLVTAYSGYSQDPSTENHLRSDKGTLIQARELKSKNKNAEALDVLQRQGAKIVPQYVREQDSIVKSLTDKFAVEKNAMVKEITGKESKVKELKSGNEDLDRENTILTTNTIIFFSVLIGIVVFILLGRMRILRKSKEKLNYANSLLSEIENTASSIPAATENLKTLRKPLVEANTHINNTSTLLTALIADKNHTFHKQAKQLVNNTDAVLKMSNNRLQPDEDKKVQTDLNRIIEEVVSQTYFAMISRYPEFKCTVVKDLEKILPTLEVYPEDIRFVLFNLFENAFDAVRLKKETAPTGYVPTVTVSTRKLPRFVQIRVKDNGIGISDKAGKKVFDPFYSESNSTTHPGLGLSESQRIIAEKHKGELYIDSDLASSTDFIIRFPTVQLI